jgi:Creatinine amidohydrolase.
MKRFFPSFGHADAVETSIIASISKELVRWDRVVDVEVSGNINVVRTIDVSSTGIIGTLRRDLIKPEFGAELLRFIIDDLINQLRIYYPTLESTPG